MSETEKNNNEELINKIKKWLDKGGIPFEMATARLLQAAGFGFRQGLYFNDPVGDKPRELDILAYKSTNSGYPLNINFLFECKHTSHPLLLINNPESGDPERKIWTPEISTTLANREGEEYLTKLGKEGEFQEFPLFHINEVPGYSLLTSFIDESQGKDIGYIALNQITNLAIGYKSNFAKYQKVHHIDEIGALHYWAEWLVPIVVVSGNLFRAYLDLENEIKIEKIDSGLISWFHPTIGNVVVRIYEIEALSFFVKAVDATFDYLDDLALNILYSTRIITKRMDIILLISGSAYGGL